jgi:hypothetical protein
MQHTRNPTSYEIYRLNFIDQEFCENCASSSFIKAISKSSICKSNNLISNVGLQIRVDSLYYYFSDSGKRIIEKTTIDNKLLVSFSFSNGDHNIYSYITDGEWLLNDSIVVKPKRDVLEIIRKFEEIEDLTDYRYVSKGPVPAD